MEKEHFSIVGPNLTAQIGSDRYQDPIAGLQSTSPHGLTGEINASLLVHYAGTV